jgi:hypothetical protein
MRTRRYVFVACLLTGLLLWTSFARAQVADAGSPANAAIQYWQAFALMPTLDSQQEQRLEKWNSVPLDDEVQKLIAASHGSLRYLRRGAAIAACDWGLDYNEGMSLMLPHLAKARTLARLAALRARFAFEQGRNDDALSDAHAIMALGRHTGRDPLIISVLVRIMIEETAIELVAPHVVQLNIPYAQAAMKFDSLPPTANIEQSIGLEKKYMAEWAINRLQEAEKRKQGSGLALARQWFGGDTPADVLKDVRSTDEVIQLLGDILPLYDRLAELFVLSNSEFDAQYPVFIRQAKADHPLARVFLPAFDKSLATQNRHDARMAMILWPRAARTSCRSSKIPSAADPSNIARSIVVSNCGRSWWSTVNP